MAFATSNHNPAWTRVIPLASWVVLLMYWSMPDMPGVVTLLCAGLLGSVITAVHHAEVIALKVGEPFGTLVLALSVTIIEVALIVSMMLSASNQQEAMALPRDTIFAAVMIILNGIIGLSLLVGGRKNGIQQFNLEGVTDALCTTTVIVVIALVLPNYVISAEGPVYSRKQLGFVALITLVLFTAFTLFQTMSRREYFAPIKAPAQLQVSDSHHEPSTKTALTSLAFLLLALIAVVLSAKGISPTLEALLGRWGAPASILGIVIAAIVLMPEFTAAMRAARDNRLQISLNLAIGSAIASIGLTIPAVAIVALIMGWPLTLGLDAKSTVLLVLTLFVTAMSLRTGNTTFQPGLVHLMIFAVYLFFSFVP